MTKLRKQRRKKKFNYGRDRKRERNKQEKFTKFNVKVDCKTLKDSWDNTISVKGNMDSMGVCLNPNSAVGKISTKKDLVVKMKKERNKPFDEKSKKDNITKPEIVLELEQEAKFVAKQSFRFTSTQVQLISHLIDKHGSDYSAMARDPKNHYQETSNKIKGMVTKFISIPEHYVVYCRERGLISKEDSSKEDEDVGEEEDDEDENLKEDEEENEDLDLEEDEENNKDQDSVVEDQ